MATRFRIVPNSVTDITPAFGAYADTTQAVRRAATTQVMGALPVENRAGSLTGGAANNALTVQFISAPLQAQTLNGATTINWVAYASEGDAADNIDQVVYRIAVYDSTGTVLRGTFKALTIAGVTELTAPPNASVVVATGATGTTVVCQAGDRLVFEVGFGESGVGGTPNWTTQWGGSGADATQTTGSTTGNVPWVELSQTLLFIDPVQVVHTTNDEKTFTYISVSSPGSQYLSLWRLLTGQTIASAIATWTIGNTGEYPQGLVRPQGPLLDSSGWAELTSNGWGYWVDNEAPLDIPVTYVAYDALNNFQLVQTTPAQPGVPMTITRSAAGTLTEQGTGGTTSFTVNYPPTTVLNEVLILDVGSSGGTPTTPAGWTLIAGSQQAAADSSYGYWKVATGSEGGTNFVITLATAGRATAVITRYNNVNTSFPIDVAGTTAQTASGNSLTIAGFNTVTDKCLPISGVCANAAVGLTWTQPAGWTAPIVSTGTGKGAAYSDGPAITPAGPSGSIQWGLSTTTNIDGWYAALRPFITSPPSSGTNATYQPNAGAFWLRDPQNPALDLPAFNITPTASDCLPKDGIYFSSWGDEAYGENSDREQADDSPLITVGVRKRSGRSSTITLVARTFVSRDALLNALASGNVMFFQAPAGYGIPDGYIDVGDVGNGRPLSDHRRQWRVLSLPVVAAMRPVGVASGGPGQLWSDTTSATWPYDLWSDINAANINTKQLLVLVF